MHRSRALVSLFLLTMLILTACQSGSTPETITSPAPTNPPPTEPPPTSTLPPTAIPTETPAGIMLEPGQCIQLLENGDFETGSITPWVETSNQNNSLIANFRAHNGKYHGLLGSNDGADEFFAQEFTIPANAATVTLSYWWSVATQETDKTTPHDKLTVSVDDQTGKALQTLAEYSNTTPVEGMSFYEATHDLTAYAGQTIQITFHGVLDTQTRSDFSIDDVAVEACGPAPEVAVATQPPTTAAPTAAALGKGECIELIQNGDFETGSAVPWTETTKLKQTLVIEFPGAHGKFSAFLGGGSGLEESLAQEVEIPSSAAAVTLTYWWAHGGRERDGKAHDFLHVVLQDVTGKELATLEEISNITPPDREYAQSTQDLTAYVGQNIRLVFHVVTDAQNDSDFFVDDVSMQACGPK